MREKDGSRSIQEKNGHGRVCPEGGKESLGKHDFWGGGVRKRKKLVQEVSF